MRKWNKSVEQVALEFTKKNKVLNTRMIHKFTWLRLVAPGRDMVCMTPLINNSEDLYGLVKVAKAVDEAN